MDPLRGDEEDSTPHNNNCDVRKWRVDLLSGLRSDDFGKDDVVVVTVGTKRAVTCDNIAADATTDTRSDEDLLATMIDNALMLSVLNTAEE